VLDLHVTHFNSCFADLRLGFAYHEIYPRSWASVFRKPLGRDAHTANESAPDVSNAHESDQLQNTVVPVITAVSGTDLHHKVVGVRSDKAWGSFISPLRTSYLMAAVQLSSAPLEQVMYAFFKFQKDESYLSILASWSLGILKAQTGSALQEA
jgi:hypothetical protein